MRVNVLQHTPNEGPGTIKEWADLNNYELYTYHPYQFGILPKAEETDFLIILGGPMSPNDDLPWILEERNLIDQLLKFNKPIFGACYGAQQIAKVLGSKVLKSPAKEVGFAPVYLKSSKIEGIPSTMTALHWHEEMFEIPQGADLLFSSDLLRNQGFLYKDHVIGLQFHFEPDADSVREMVVNDGDYALNNNQLYQTPQEIITTKVPVENRQIMFNLLDFINN